jgi:hypothetical protein
MHNTTPEVGAIKSDVRLSSAKQRRGKGVERSRRSSRNASQQMMASAANTAS